MLPLKSLPDRLRTFFRILGLDERRCAVCLTPFSPKNSSDLLCAECAEQLRPRLGGYCPQCGAVFPLETGEPHLCAECLRRRAGAEHTRPWERVLFYGAYDGLLRRLLLDFKYKDRLSHQRLLRTLARRALELRLPVMRPEQRQWDLIVPVPLHVRRLRTRGFNQSLVLARAVSRMLSCPLRPSALQRLRDTRPQFNLPPGERVSNIKNAFAADAAQVRGAAVLLVDDIMTTGATVNEAARCLRRAGARRVDVFVLARAAE